MHQQGDALSHHQKLTSLPAHGSILKNFWEPTSVDAKVILLVEDDKTIYIPIELETLGVFMFMYMMITGISTKRWTLILPKFDEP